MRSKLFREKSARKFALGICWMHLFFLSTSLFAGQPQPTFTEKVVFIETDDATCIANDGKLISIGSVDKSQSLDVWVDRWFMGVQTPDHTKQRLNLDNPVADLGCSKTSAGAQHWTIHSIILR